MPFLEYHWIPSKLKKFADYSICWQVRHRLYIFEFVSIRSQDISMRNHHHRFSHTISETSSCSLECQYQIGMPTVFQIIGRGTSFIQFWFRRSLNNKTNGKKKQNVINQKVTQRIIITNYTIIGWNKGPLQAKNNNNTTISNNIKSRTR